MNAATISHRFSSAVKKIQNFRVLLAIILIIAAAVRIWHIVAIYPLPLFDELTIDSKLYDDWAQYIANGNWLGGKTPFYMDPLYPYLLAVQYKIFGHDLFIVRAVQAASGVATCLLIAVIGRRAGGDFVGLLAAAVAALYQPLIFEGGEIEKTAIGILLVTGAMACATGKSTVTACSAGALLALASLCRANLLLMGPFGALYFLCGQTRHPSSEVSNGARRVHVRLTGEPARQAMAFTFGFILLLSPVLLRNHYVSGEWILTTSQSGSNFYTGNNPANSTGLFTAVPFVRAIPEFEEHDFHIKAEELAGKKLSSRDVSNFWFREALKHIANDPSFAAQVFIRKFILFWSDLESSDGWSFYFIKKFSLPLNLPLFTFGWLFPFALVGAVVSVRTPDRTIRLMVWYVMIYSCSVILFFIFSRYRIYVVPPLIIFAALGVKWLWDRFQERMWRRLALGVCAVVAAAIFSFCGTVSFVKKTDMFVYDYSQLAEMYARKGDYNSAETLLQEALRIQPESAEILYTLGSLHLNIEDLEEAIHYFRHCLEVNPEFPAAWKYLGMAYEKSGNAAEAKRCYEKQP